MWAHSRAGFKYTTGTSSDSKAPDDAHSHSPTKSASAGSSLAAAMSSQSSGPHQVYNAWAPNRAFPLPVWQHGYQDPRYVNHHRFLEPFAVPAPSFLNEAGWGHRGARSSREDIPMPDYSSSASSRAISGGTGISYDQIHVDDDQYNLLIQALTPTKSGGVRAPSNTPSATVNAAKLGLSPSGNVKSKKETFQDDTQETPKRLVKQVLKEAVKENSREVSEEMDDTSISTL